MQKATLEGLRALHSSRHVFGADAHARRGDLKGRIGNPEFATQDAVHPVVIRHPETGRKALYVNPGFTVRFEGWTEEESRPLLEYLYRQAVRPEFTCRFHWRAGSLALLGQPLDLALRGKRLPRRAPPLASHHDRRRAAMLRPLFCLGLIGAVRAIGPLAHAQLLTHRDLSYAMARRSPSMAGCSNGFSGFPS